ncbi:transglutaminase domain-containing protein, partial [Candidatus Woesebacteria bacterium]|nr:transglutaminase domain-containing protein [Candidatus Woesebacteria bacterium]
VSRAAGIPARRATGYAVTQNSRLRPLSLVADVLHAWPEYYDTQRNIWVPIDPTWADTTGGVDYFSKLDLRHITFAIQGRDDTLPLPAGLYKLPEQETKDIEITLLDNSPEQITSLEIEKREGLVPRFGLPTELTFLIKNTSGQARYNVDIAIGVLGDIEVLSDTVVSVPVLLPFEETEVTVALAGQDWLTASQGTLRLLLEEESYEYQVSARQAFSSPYAKWVALGGGVALFSAGAGSLLVFGGRWYRSVRR